ncbi:TrkH family potassium uptake protein [Fuscibacter oryzae]|uniref:TrkH family potassium uptake protein n=1 Tax=Fuscibacter oryzae TaxID=2803939 RepID=A0A8J7MPR1_9RHOB|nr:TrkH family potassium uptake protein [Fuscibacter oryzae]MBL4927478.1 TrkH family potassium uptake protein [Fuscibacter oryzae]
MQRLGELPLLVVLMVLTGLAMLVPAFHAEVLQAHRVARAFVYAAIMVFVLAGMLGIVIRPALRRPGARHQLLTVALPYLVLPPLLALPMLPEEGGGLQLRDAWFDMLAAFTTTGATIFGPPDLSPSVHLWRAMVGWLGGLYILVVALAVLMPLNLGGMEVLSGRTPGRGSGAAQITEVAGFGARLMRFSLRIAPLYAGMTLALWILLLLAGEDNLIALCHAMSTLSTSGISPVGGLAAGRAGWPGEVLVFAFLLLALSRWPLTRALGLQRAQPLWHDPELRAAALLLAVVPMVIVLRLWWGAAQAGAGADIAALLRAWWSELFMALSFLTTTGFESANWPQALAWAHQPAAAAAFWGLAILGGGVATTAGGIRLLRVVALFRHSRDELERLIHPNLVTGQYGAARQIARQGVALAWVFFTLFGLSLAATTGLLSLTGQGFENAMIMSIAALTNTAPVVSILPELGQPWAMVDLPGRIVLGAAMVLGRLDILAVLVLFLPDTWRG